MTNVRHDILKAMQQRVLILDGATGTYLQRLALTEEDFRGTAFANHPTPLKGCNDVLCITKPEAIMQMHRDYIDAGADIIETNSFNCNRFSLADYGLEDKVYEIAKAAAEVAKRAIATDHGPLRLPQGGGMEDTDENLKSTADADDTGAANNSPQQAELTSVLPLGGARGGLIAGSIGPTNRTLSMSGDVNDPAAREVTFGELVETYSDCVRGLMDGGADLILIETIFDTLNAKAAIKAVKDVAQERGIDIPIMISATLSDASGRTLSGQTVEAFVASVRHANPISIGLNCGFGAKQLMPWLERLSKIADCPVSVHPNAGLPNVMGGYDETPETFAAVAREVFEKRLVNIYGGCCGTTPEHIRAISRLQAHGPLRLPQGGELEDTEVPVATPQQAEQTPILPLGGARGGHGLGLFLSGLEPLVIDRSKEFVSIGERTNVAGSAKFKRLIKEKNYEEALTVARQQVNKGAEIIDICMDDGMIDGVEAMTTFLRLIASEPDIARVPVMIDSSKWEIIKAGLENVQGKSIVNSISLKEGEEKFIEKARHIHAMGAATVVMLFDENGQADSYERKMEVARRAYRILKEIGFPTEDVIFDPNVLSVATGMPEHDDYARAFIEACRTIHEEMPEVHLSGGISNLSFSFRGNNTIRQAMHSVFLHHAMAAGLDMSIVNPAMTTVYEDIPKDMLEIVEDVILNRQEPPRGRTGDTTASCETTTGTEETPTPSERLIEYAMEVKAREDALKGDAPVAPKQTEKIETLSLSQRIERAMLQGLTDTIETDTLEALKEAGTPLGVIDNYLMPAMEKVGELFGEGKMFLPQVVKSARVMKKAVAVIEPFMQQNATVSSCSPNVIVATVKGDVHDIGKNIVGVVMQCNGFNVKDLGVMVEPETIVDEAQKMNADVIGLSGLITPSLEEMIKVLRLLESRGMTTPVIVGGATTSPLHTAVKMAPEYPHGIVIHAHAAADNPGIIRRLLAEDSNEYKAELLSQQRIIRENYEQKNAGSALLTIEEARNRRHIKKQEEVAVPTPEAMRMLHTDNHSLLHPKSGCLCCDPLVPLINWQMFLGAWGIKGHFPEVLDDPEKGPEAQKLYRDAQQLLEKIIRLRLLRLQMKAQILPAHQDGDDIVITTDDGKQHHLPMPRSLEDEAETRCLADYVMPIAKAAADNSDNTTATKAAADATATGAEQNGKIVATKAAAEQNGKIAKDYICPFVVSAGVGLKELQEQFRKDNDEYHAILAKLLADRLAEAMAEKLSRDLTDTLHWGTKNIRMAFGYGACPDHSLKQEVFDILKVDETMGLSLTDSFMINPGESICGLIFAETPEKYFNV